MNLEEELARLPSFLAAPDESVYWRGNYVVLDFETTNRNKGSALDETNELVLASWCVNGGKMRSKRGTEFEQDELVGDVLQADFIVAHNAKFELGWLRRCGVTKPLLVFDTMLADYVIGGNRWLYSKLSLEQCLKRWRIKHKKESVVSRMIRTGICPSTIPAPWLQHYCEKDVLAAHALYLEQRTYFMGAPKLLSTFYTRCLTSYVLSEIEPEGMMLDEAAVVEEADKLEREVAALENELNTITGGINLASPKQLGEFIYDRLGFTQGASRGNKKASAASRSTDEAAIRALQPTTAVQHRFIDAFREHRSKSSALTKYLRKFRQCCSERGGILKAVFNQSNTATHRLSSSGMEYRTQFQNLQREYKPLFRAKRDGFRIAEADGAQLEFRVAAHLGGDIAAIEAISNGVDVHTETAAVLGVTRQEAKSDTFKPLYGGRRGTPAQERYYKYFRDKYAGITAEQDRWVHEVLATGKLETACLDFYWPDTRMERSGYITNTPAICNYPVQSLATAEIIPIALVYMWHMLRARGARTTIINTVHDSVVAEVPEEEVQLFTDLARLCFIEVVYWYLSYMYNIRFCAPLGVGVAFGSKWGDSEAKKSEQKFNAQENLWNLSEE